MITRSDLKRVMEREPKFDDIMLSLRATGKQPKGIIEEVRQVIAIARKFNEEVTRPGSLGLDRKMHEDPDHLAWDLVKKANERGLYTMFLPKIFGGKGYNLSCVGYFCEELASSCGAVANIVGVHYLGVTMLFSSWNLKVISRICKDIVDGEKSGEPCLLSLAMTEPNAGTDSQNVEFMDTGSLACHARKVDGGYRLNGTKIFISMGHMSTWHLVHSYTNLNKASENTVMLAVKTGSQGFAFGKKEKKMGQKGCPASELVFNDCFVADDQVCIDNRDTGKFKRSIKETNEQIFAYIWGASRMGVGAFGTGTARAAFEEALKFAREHELDGSSLINQEWCQTLLAEMYKNVLVARISYAEATYANGMHGLWRVINFKPMYYLIKYTPTTVLSAIFPRLSQLGFMTTLFRKICFDYQSNDEMDRVDGWGSFAKVVGTDAGVANARMALEIMGHAGIRQDHRAEKILRDSKLFQIYEGTNQINRLNLFKRLIMRQTPQAKVFSSANL